MIDYSEHRLRMLQLDKDMHKLLLQQKDTEALEKAYQVMAEQKLVINAIKDRLSQHR